MAVANPRVLQKQKKMWIFNANNQNLVKNSKKMSVFWPLTYLYGNISDSNCQTMVLIPQNVKKFHNIMHTNGMYVSSLFSIKNRVDTDEL